MTSPLQIMVLPAKGGASVLRHRVRLGFALPVLELQDDAVLGMEGEGEEQERARGPEDDGIGPVAEPFGIGVDGIAKMV